MGGCPRGEMVKELDCRIVVNEFEVYLHYCIHFRTNPHKLVGWLGFYGISTFVGYLTPNPFFMKIVLFQTIQKGVNPLILSAMG